jgi:hypothetical protein
MKGSRLGANSQPYNSFINDYCYSSSIGNDVELGRK